MRLTKKEIGRADNGVCVAVRKQQDKTYSIFLVQVDGTIIVERTALLRKNIPYVVADLMRDCDKGNAGRFSDMADASRDRNYCAGKDSKILYKA